LNIVQDVKCQILLLPESDDVDDNVELIMMRMMMMMMMFSICCHTEPAKAHSTATSRNLKKKSVT